MAQLIAIFTRGLVAIGCLIAARAALAGGGPENVFLVVNAASWASQTIANHYIAGRKIPPDNVCYLDWEGGFESADFPTFRREILLPVLGKIQQRGLESQIDYVVYSSDFPTAIIPGPDLAGVQLPSQLAPTASLNSATFLWQHVLGKSPEWVRLGNNHYARIDLRGALDRPPHGFRSWYGWGPKHELLEAGGERYYLSTVLAVTSGRGNSVDEALAALDRSAKADGTHPAGTIYYMQNDDVPPWPHSRKWGCRRSCSREPCPSAGPTCKG